MTIINMLKERLKIAVMHGIKDLADALPEIIETAEAIDAREPKFPDIGPDPLRHTLHGEWLRASRNFADRLTLAHVKQQPLVPDQTALVWRIDLARMCSNYFRFEAGHALFSKVIKERDQAREALAQLRKEHHELKEVHGELISKTNVVCITASQVEEKALREELLDIAFQARLWGIDSCKFDAQKAYALGKRVDELAERGSSLPMPIEKKEGE